MKNRFFGQIFFECSFYKVQMYIFEVSLKKTDFFDTSIDLFKGKIFLSHELKSPTTTQYFEKTFYINRL